MAAITDRDHILRALGELRERLVTERGCDALYFNLFDPGSNSFKRRMMSTAVFS